MRLALQTGGDCAGAFGPARPGGSADIPEDTDGFASAGEHTLRKLWNSIVQNLRVIGGHSECKARKSAKKA